MVRNQHIDLEKLGAAIAMVVNAFTELDVIKVWGGSTRVAADGTQVQTCIDNSPTETSIRYRGVGASPALHQRQSTTPTSYCSPGSFRVGYGRQCT